MRNSKTLLPLIILFLIILSRFLFGDINDISFCSFSLIVVAIAIIVYFISQQRSELKDWWVRPSNILLFGLLVVNLQYILDLCMGYRSDVTIRCEEKAFQMFKTAWEKADFKPHRILESLAPK